MSTLTLSIPPSARSSTAASRAAPPPRAVAAIASAPMPSDQLLQGRKAVEISHNGSVYRLQSTKLGKLILTK